MAEERVQRRLAAILAADVVGYSRLMGKDETGTLSALKQHRAGLIDPSIAEHRGRIVKLMGDGVLVEFASIVDAVECAVGIQHGMIKRNADTPENDQITFRIGINLGDIIIDDDDIYGDGVNVAARLEGEADPGGICISGDAYRQVVGKIDYIFEDLGERNLKNIAEPVKAYRWRDEIAAIAALSQSDQASVPDGEPSIAVLAFNNMSGDPEQEYFSDGIAEDIITDMSKVSGLFVIARNSSFTYKGQSVNLKRVASELGVNFILEGSVRKAANKVRVTAQLVDVTNGGHVWADRYDRDLDDIFAIQDDITRNIVEALKVELDLGDQAHPSSPRTTNMEAFDLQLRGRRLLSGFTPDGFAEAAQLFERSIELDPAYVSAYPGLALTHFISFTNGWNGATEKSLEIGIQNAEKAVEIDPTEPEAYWALALGRFWQHNIEDALSAIDKGVALGPNHAEIHATRGLHPEPFLSTGGSYRESRVLKRRCNSIHNIQRCGFTLWVMLTSCMVTMNKQRPC